MAYKKTFKERFEGATFFGMLAMPVLGGVGGGWLGATSSLATGTAAAVALGTGGVALGVVAGAAVGAAGFFAANAIYKNKEYIALAVIGLTTLPFLLAGKGLKALGAKFSLKSSTPAQGNHPATQKTQPPVATEKKAGSTLFRKEKLTSIFGRKRSKPENTPPKPIPPKPPQPPASSKG